MAQKLESEAHHPNTDDEPENRLLYRSLNSTESLIDQSRQACTWHGPDRDASRATMFVPV